jgi:hypothetical protein
MIPFFSIVEDIFKIGVGIMIVITVKCDLSQVLCVIIVKFGLDLLILMGQH